MTYISNKDFMLEISKGTVAGHSKVNKFGHNTAVPITGADVWGGNGTYDFFPTSAQTVQIQSDDAADTNGGTGAWTVQVYGLDANWEEQEETVTMNGVTPVALTGTYIRMFRAVVLTAGSTETNEGNITVTATVGGEVAIHVAGGDGQTQHAIYTVPANKTAYFIQGYMAMADDDKNGEVARFQWLSRPNTVANGAWAVKGEVSLNSIGTGTWTYIYGVPSGGIPEKTDIKIRVTEATAILGVVGGFDLVLVDDTLLP